MNSWCKCRQNEIDHRYKRGDNDNVCGDAHLFRNDIPCQRNQNTRANQHKRGR